jgi:hypothetical protein
LILDAASGASVTEAGLRGSIVKLTARASVAQSGRNIALAEDHGKPVCARSPSLWIEHGDDAGGPERGHATSRRVTWICGNVAASFNRQRGAIGGR